MCLLHACVHTIVDLSITSFYIIIQDTVFILYGGYRSNQSNELVLPNYQCVRCDRDRYGGDVLMFIHSSLVCNVLCRDVVDCELLVVSVISPHCSHNTFCLAVYYRPPSAPLDSLIHLSSALLSISPSYTNNLILF